MRVYLTPPQPSRGLQRIADALTRHAPPGTEFTTELREADLVILYSIGRNDAMREKAHSIVIRGQHYAVIQVCLRSTLKPKTIDWQWLWTGADCVWSYYDLRQAVIDDYGDPNSIGVSEFDKHVNFYHAPLGADARVFKPFNKWIKYKVITSGLSRLSESVRECHLAAQAIGAHSCHLGARLKLGEPVDCYRDLRDDDLSYLYSQCEFVSGLRRTEGFELPAVEGLLCGARPLVFDTPDYHWNYGPHAEYLHEGTRQEVVDQLVELFKRGARPVTADEREQAVERFNWETIVRGFYERLGVS